MRVLISLWGLCTLVTMTVHAESIFNTERYSQYSLVQVGDIVYPQVVRLDLDYDLGPGPLILVNENNPRVPLAFNHLRTSNNEYELDTQVRGYSSHSPLHANTDGLHYFDNTATSHWVDIQVSRGLVNSIAFDLADHVIRPQYVSVQYQDQDTWRTLVDRIPYQDTIPTGQIDLQDTTVLRIGFETRQLLGISNIRAATAPSRSTQSRIVWYAHPHQQYRIYHGAHFGYWDPGRINSSQPLGIDNTTIQVFARGSSANDQFNPDYDRDGIIDEIDLCPRVADSSNQDRDRNARGDVCEDKDQDGVIMSLDNCPFVYNPNQQDQDLDGTGDSCDQQDNRTSEQLPYLEWLMFALVASLLGVLAWRSRTRPDLG